MTKRKTLKGGLEDNYLHQAGGTGGMMKFRGGPSQRGTGLGGFFSNLVRQAIPLLKKGLGIAAPHAMNVGKKVLSDTLEGRNVGESMKKRLVEGGRGVKRDVFMRVAGNLKSSQKLKKSKKKRPAVISKVKPSKKRRVQQRPDAF